MILPLSPPVFQLLSALVEERAGLHYTPRDAEIVASKVSPRAIELGLDSLLDYYYYLRYDDPDHRELDALVESLVVHESYFFREYDQLLCLVDDVLAPRARAGERLRVWSAACASGEEPYTLAMLLADRGILDQVEIVASDVSEAALVRARRGELPARSLREVPDPSLAARWLRRRDKHVVVDEALRSRVEVRRVNLFDGEEVRALGAFDAILCRNVLIYFADDAVRRVVALLREQLREDGTLWVGVSESLLRWAPALEHEERHGAFFYRRKAA